MKHSPQPKFTHTYTLAMQVKVDSNSAKALDVTAGDMWAAILHETDMSDHEFLIKVGSPTNTETQGMKSTRYPTLVSSISN